MLSCVKFAQVKGSDEVPFQTAAILAEIAKRAPKDTHSTDIHIPVINGLYEIAVYQYTKRNFILAEEVVGHQFSILAHMLSNKDHYFIDTLRYVLDKLELLAPLAIANEALADHISMVYPLGKAYGLVNVTSLGYLFEQAAAILPSLDGQHDWVNPYCDVIEIEDVIASNLRNIAENNEFGDSFLLWDIDGTIKHIAGTIARIVDKPLRPDCRDESKLVDKLQWVMAFYWVAFEKKKTISKRRTDDICDSLVFIGLLFFGGWYPTIVSLSSEENS
jgi:hypothetical protein